MSPERRTARLLIPRPGEVLTIQENDYRFGLGELVMRVVRTGAVVRLDDGEWLTVAGVQIAWNGADVAELEVLVRLSSLVRRGGKA
jgi:hypothetical protein